LNPAPSATIMIVARRAENCQTGMAAGRVARTAIYAAWNSRNRADLPDVHTPVVKVFQSFPVDRVSANRFKLKE